MPYGLDFVRANLRSGFERASGEIGERVRVERIEEGEALS